MTQYALTMLLAGIGIPLLAGLNAALGKYIGSPATAAVILFLVALSISLVVMVVMGTEGFNQLLSAPKHLFLAGAFVAFYVLTITYIAPHFGVGNAVFFV
ncbi:MAG: EamA-like transporter family protein, partial [Rhodobacteraceae bacterium]|nr:EamA-like transporter family protein [Paracoccaceae bacterium]